MRYQGGKSRLKKIIVPLLMQHNPTRIIEPFLGGGSIMVETHKQGYKGEYLTGDYNADLNEMWRATIEDGWLPTDEMKPTREQYETMKRAVDAEPTALRGLLRTGATFGAKPWDTFILDRIHTGSPHWSYWEGTINGAHRDAPHITNKNITITGGDYREYAQHITADSVIYCDPPYQSTAGYGTEFDHTAFWNTVRQWSKLCPVYVSEYSAPDDFVAIYTKELAQNNNRTQTGEKRGRAQDSIYVHNSQTR